MMTVLSLPVNICIKDKDSHLKTVTHTPCPTPHHTPLLLQICPFYLKKNIRKCALLSVKISVGHIQSEVFCQICQVVSDLSFRRCSHSVLVWVFPARGSLLQRISEVLCCELVKSAVVAADVPFLCPDAFSS